MIKKMQPLSMAEAEEYVKPKKDAEYDVKAFMKNFVKTKPEKAKELRKKLEDLEIIKLNSRHISKIIDLVPTDKSELNKITSDAGLDEDESNKILETVKSVI